MALTRKKYIVDKKFQYGLSFRAIILPLVSVLAVCAVLLYYADSTKIIVTESDGFIDEIVSNQDALIDMFLSTPALQKMDNPVIKEGHHNFTDNIGKLKKIKDNSRLITKNSTIVLYVLIALTVIQSIVIFLLFIVVSHRISGPIQVMSRHLDEFKKGNVPVMRPLRKKDELRDFYEKLCATLKYLHEQKKTDN